jgi:pyruvate-formate lyase-activating enzyme
MEPSRHTLALTLECDNACVFCAQSGLDAATPDRASLSASLRALRDAGHEALTFVGGEPLCRDDLEDLVAEAHAIGFVEIGLQTNGVQLGQDPGQRARRLTRLADGGLTDLHFSLHGARAEAHDHHTQHPGSFDHAVAAMTFARSAGLTTVVTTVVTRSNQAVLSELPPRLASLGVAAWHVTVPIARGRAEDDAASIMPRLALALPYALHALARAERAGIAVFVSGAPLCLLGPFATRSLATTPRAHHGVCQGCPARTDCPGVDPLYLARFGGDELRARPAPERGPASHLARLFVGVGAMADKRPAEALKPRLVVTR